MKRTLLLIIGFLLAISIIRECRNPDPAPGESNFIHFSTFVDRIADYEFSFEGTVEHWDYLQGLVADLPTLSSPSAPDACEGITDVVAYLGRCMVWLYDLVVGFFSWLGSIFSIIGNFIATIYYVVVDLAKNIGNLLSMVGWFFGFGTA